MNITIPEGPATVAEQIEAVRAYAQEKYEAGWDSVIECYSQTDIRDMISGCKTRWGAIFRVKKTLDIQNAYAAEIKATAY
jgi:hypothetical protein